MQFAYLVVLATWFASIAFYFGPSWILFHKLRWITPADFADAARERVAPIVLAVKQYEADNGRLPDESVHDLQSVLVPAYLIPPKGRDRLPGYFYLDEGDLHYLAKFNHMIVYRFRPQQEGWSVAGAFTSGPIPLPPVAFDPAAPRPATRPATTRAVPRRR